MPSVRIEKVGRQITLVFNVSVGPRVLLSPRAARLLAVRLHQVADQIEPPLVKPNGTAI